MLKKVLICIALLGCTTERSMHAQWNTQTRVAVGTLLVAGGTYVCSKAYAECVVAAARSRFAPERELLTWYGQQYGRYWGPQEDASLKISLANMMSDLHNRNRNKWTITVLYELASGEPSYFVRDCFQDYPLLQQKDDLDWYIKRLKVIRFVHLHGDRQELDSLIEQLEYVRRMLLSFHGYSIEEQHFRQHALVP